MWGKGPGEGSRPGSHAGQCLPAPRTQEGSWAKWAQAAGRTEKGRPMAGPARLGGLLGLWGPFRWQGRSMTSQEGQGEEDRTGKAGTELEEVGEMP